jgi:Glycosyl hydrolases family 25
MLIPDISEWQPGADIAGIRRQTPAIILRAGYGANHLDYCFNRWRPQARAARYAWTGLYHYLRADQDAAAQAQVFCSWVGTLSLGEIPILDLEEGAGDQSGRAYAWLNYVDAHFGLTARPLNSRSWLYSYRYFISGQGLGGIFNSERRCWLAAYQATEPPLPPHSLWQSTNGVAGANRVLWAGAGYCDTSYTPMTVAELFATGWQGTVPPPPVTDPVPEGWTDAIMSDLPTLRQGDSGNDVRSVQGLLVARGHPAEPGTADLGVDGVFGAATDAVIRSVQQVKAGTGAGAVTGLVIWALVSWVPWFRSGVPEPVAIAVPVILAWAGHTIAAYLAPHTHRPDLAGPPPPVEGG